MKRNTFIKTSAILATGSLLSPLAACKNEVKQPTQATKTVRKNWAKNYAYKAENLHQPSTVEEIQALVKQLDKQKALGSCHCFNNIADSSLNQISTQNLNKVLNIDEKAQTITVEAGVRYGQFAPELDKKGFALHNLASLPHISVAGAFAAFQNGFYTE